jgi:group I intron endonuclease
MVTIYKITNLINGKLYVGQTVQPLRKRWFGHVSNRKRSAISSAIQKYGVSNFKIEAICSALSEEFATELEIYFINILDCLVPNGYNILEGGDVSNRRGHPSWNLGLETPEYVKQKLSNAHKGQKAWNKGVSMSESQKQKLSDRLKGIRRSPATEYKKGMVSTFKGKKHTPESLQKIRDNNAASRKVICIETGEVFPSIIAVALKYNIAKSHLRRLIIAGKKSQQAGLTFQFA